MPAWGTPPPAPSLDAENRGGGAGWRRARGLLGGLAAVAVVGAALAFGVTDALHPESTPAPETDAPAAADAPQAPSGDGNTPASGLGETSAAWKDIDNLKAGDCADVDYAATDNSGVFVVPCEGPHNEEVVGTATLAKGSWPGQVAVDAASDAACRQRFRAYVGVEETASALTLTWYGLDEELWSLGDRLVVCVVDSDSAVTTSVKGSKR